MFDECYDIVVVGAGHAGCEAAHAAARMGLSTALYTMNADLIAQMSCNPAVGGIAKGHLVREVDALGGIMGLAADQAGIQFRLLNTSRGPAVWSPRAQADKAVYGQWLRQALQNEPNIAWLIGTVGRIVAARGEDGRGRYSGRTGDHRTAGCVAHRLLLDLRPWLCQLTRRVRSLRFNSRNFPKKQRYVRIA